MKNFSQAEFAEKLECSQPNLNKIENGNSGISSRLRHRLMTAFPDLNMNWLDQGTGPMINSHTPIHIDKSVSYENSKNRKSLIQTLEKMIVMFERGEVQIEVMMAVLDSLKSMVKQQEKRISELEEDKALLKSVMVRFRDENLNQ